MDSDKALERIHKLIRLALHNPSLEEARSAALRAVQLVAEHGVELARPAPRARPGFREFVRRAAEDAERRTATHWPDAWERQRTAQQRACRHRWIYDPVGRIYVCQQFGCGLRVTEGEYAAHR